MRGAPTRWIPLWKRKVKYPLYWAGDPQLRLFTPMFWMKLVKPKYRSPPDSVMFHCHPQMSKHDIKQYLEKIYGIPVSNVQSEFRKGETRHDPVYGFEVVPGHENFRVAYVTLKEGTTFEWPDILGAKQVAEDKEIEEWKKRKDTEAADKEKTKDFLDVPFWFRN